MASGQSYIAKNDMISRSYHLYTFHNTHCCYYFQPSYVINDVNMNDNIYSSTDCTSTNIACANTTNIKTETNHVPYTNVNGTNTSNIGSRKLRVVSSTTIEATAATEEVRSCISEILSSFAFTLSHLVSPI